MSERRTPPAPVRALCLLAAALLLPAGCLERRSEPSGDAASTECASCHGDPSRAGDALRRSAPPIDLSGASLPSYPGVGAHDIHLSATETHGPVECDECHVVPESTGDPGHADTARPAEIVFGVLALEGMRSPSYEDKTRICADSYCHRDARAVWTSPRSSADACGTCHGLPPPPPHPPLKQCSVCHGDVIDSSRHFVMPELHVDGTVELGKPGCTDCHGSGMDPAPPVDTHGNDSPEAIGVGAHQAHLKPNGRSRPLSCEECHHVPEGIDDPSHPDGLPAEVRLSGVAETDDRVPAWDHDARTCGETWCHGPVSHEPSPLWTDPTDLSCTGCHGRPPPAPHPQSERCSACHGEVVDDAFHIVAPELHVDGAVQAAAASCGSCHGTDDDPAPPPDVRGETAPTSLGVGAHQVHLSGGTSSRPLACDECHVVPKQAVGHIDGRPAELTFSGVALTEDHAPGWDRAAATCSDTWCHGPAGSAESPSWVSVEPLGCTSCHGAPPPGPHPQMTDCALCHGEVVAASNDRIIDRMRHVDGAVDVSVPTSCTACHGSDDSPAPPPDAEGNTSTSLLSVGAHRTHVDGTSTSRAVPCATCHVVPDSVLAPGHVDTPRPAEVVFSGTALSFGAKPAYADGRCAATPCHGDVFPRGHDSGGSNTRPIWNEVDGTEAECGSCHGLPPGRPHPVADLNPVCSACHQNIAPDNRTFTRADLHVDGEVTFEVP